MPVIVVLIGVVGLLIYLASALSSADQRAMRAERDVQQVRDQQAGLTKRISALQDHEAILKSPGRTTVVLQPGKDAKAESWAAVTWGEQPDGKSFMRANGYGLQTSLEGGKTYHVWFLPQEGSPQDVGPLEIDANGDGFTMAQGLPALDQGKSVELTIDLANSKEPGEVVAAADLPKLKATMAQPPEAPGQAKSDNTSQQMHQQQPGK
ncbi:MAG: hypothetical protein ACXWLM_01305 [Myxococcales bacterium]